MNVLKRPEVWILLILIVVGIAYVLVTSEKKGGGDDLADAPAQQGDVVAGRLELENLSLTRDYGNARLDITVAVDNRGRAEIRTVPPAVRLVTGGDEDVQPFFLAGDFPPDIPADARATVTLKYWLEPEHFAGALLLEISGDSIPVKPAQPFDLEQAENGAPRPVTPGKW